MIFAPWTAYTQSLGRCLAGAFDNSGEPERTRAVRELIRTSSAAAALVTLQPIPGLDIALITPIQHKLVQGVGRVYGYHLERKDRRDLFRAFRSRLLALNATIAGAKLLPIIPLVGDLFAISVAYALTDTIGELSDRHFRMGRTMSSDELGRTFNTIYAERYERAYRIRRNELIALCRPANVRREIKSLNAAQRAGRIGEDEALQRTEALLKHRGT